MQTLKISIEKNGLETYVGEITGENAADACFSYAETYLSSSDPAAVSIHLPLQEKPFTPRETRIFFEGMLPEGFTRRSVAQWMRVQEEDYLAILAGLGNECLGAVRVMRTGDTVPPSAYHKLSDRELAELAAEGAVKSSELVIRSHLSLTGASGKTGLYYVPETAEWYLPEGDAPSTHIIKQSHIRLSALVTNEVLCLMTAARLGIETPESFILNTGDGTDGSILFASRRYDRLILPDAAEISGLPRPCRLHQEDFAQALGIASSDKYETAGAAYLSAAFRLLASYSADPVRDQLKLWDLVIYNVLVGNTDLHLKNLSLLYDRNLRGIRLAPAYDIVSTAVYDSCTRELGMSVSGEGNLDAVRREHFIREAEDLGLGVRLAGKHLDRLLSGFETALAESAAVLSAHGFPRAEEIRAEIMRRGGISGLEK